jgi:antitoxin ParD1/3/4
MATMNISLPDPMRAWVEAQTQSGQYANHSDYIRDLIRRDRKESEKLKTLQDAITQGFDSGDAGKLNMAAIKLKAKQREGLET